MATVAILTFLAGGFDGGFMLMHLFAGGLVIGALFMATDYVTSPQTAKGRIIFGIGCGLLTVVIRLFGNYPEGVSFAILFMNILVPFINKFAMTKPLGGKKV
jgi:electron transport complex protein RnfD